VGDADIKKIEGALGKGTSPEIMIPAGEGLVLADTSERATDEPRREVSGIHGHSKLEWKNGGNREGEMKRYKSCALRQVPRVIPMSSECDHI